MVKSISFIILIILILLLPLFYVASQHKQDFRQHAQTATAFATPTQVIPTLYCLGTTCPTTQPTQVPDQQPNGENGTITPDDPDSPDDGDTPEPEEGGDPCIDSQTTVQNNSGETTVLHNKHKHHGHRHGGFFQKFFEFIMEFVKQLFTKLGIPWPDDGNSGNPCLDPAPDESDDINSPTPKADEDAVPTNADVIAPTTANQIAPTTPPSTKTGSEKQVEITFYGAYDNDPPGSRAISNPVLHQEAGGIGTFDDPLTFASPQGNGEYAVGQKIYVPLVQKYFIREDVCATSWTAPNGCGAVSHVDLYVGNPSENIAVVDCENSLTPDGNATIIIDPGPDLPVDGNPIWDQNSGTCMQPH